MSRVFFGRDERRPADSTPAYPAPAPAAEPICHRRRLEPLPLRQAGIPDPPASTPRGASGAACRRPAVLLLLHRLQPFVGAALARHLNRQVGKPTVGGGAVPMLDPGGNVRKIAGQKTLRGLAPFLKEALPGDADQDLTASPIGVMNVPIVAAARLKGDVTDADLLLRKGRKIASSAEIPRIGIVWRADREQGLCGVGGHPVLCGRVLPPRCRLHPRLCPEKIRKNIFIRPKRKQNFNNCMLQSDQTRRERIMFQILVVEDDRELNRTVCAFLQQNGYEAVGCLNANEAYDAMYGGTLFDLIISDIMMPGADGFEFAQTIREQDQDIPILFMTARDDFAAKQRGFKSGIDDYMTKPIDLDELLLHIGALMRRAKIAASRKIELGKLVLDADERTAYLDGEEIPLTVREFNLIYKLLSYPKKTFTRSQLMDEFWDGDTSSGLRTVDVYMTKLRSKFAACDAFEIVTVHGLGYKAVIK